MKRKYVMKTRERRKEETRARIVDATVALHEEVGPRKTTISAIAKRADVERLTVYRYFPDEAAVFAACSHRFSERNPPPDPTGWSAEPDASSRARRGISEFYAYYSRTAAMLEQIFRDADDYPSLKQIMDGFDGFVRQCAELLADGFRSGAGNKELRTVFRHALAFTTWKTLEQAGAPDSKKTDLILKWVGALAGR